MTTCFWLKRFLLTYLKTSMSSFEPLISSRKKTWLWTGAYWCWTGSEIRDGHQQQNAARSCSEKLHESVAWINPDILGHIFNYLIWGRFILIVGWESFCFKSRLWTKNWKVVSGQMLGHFHRTDIPLSKVLNPKCAECLIRATDSLWHPP